MTAPNRVTNRCAQFIRHDGGGIAIASAISAGVLCLGVAFSIEMGRLHLEKRRQQAANDLAAMSAAANPASALASARATVRDNDLRDEDVLSLKLGAYNPDKSLGVASRFVEGGSSGPAAVELRMVRQLPMIFGDIFARTGASANYRIETSAVSASRAEAAYSIGTRLASLDGGIANAVLGGMFGGSVSLTAMDYQALASANVEMFGYFDALATRASLEAATYDDVLKQSVGLPLALQAIADMPTVSAGARSAASQLRMQLASVSTGVHLDKWVSLGESGARAPGTGGSLAVSLTALDLVSALARIASGNRQIEVNLAGGLPGGTSAKLSLAIGEPAQSQSFVRAGRPGASVKTAQTRLLLLVHQPLAGAGSLSIPLYLEAASGIATLSAVTCGASASATLAVRPSVAEAWITDPDTLTLTDFSKTPAPSPATLLRIAGLKISGQAHVRMSNLDATNVTFTSADIADSRKATVSTQQGLTTLLASLVGDLSLGVNGITLLGGATTSSVSAAITTTVPALDAALASTLAIAGVNIGSADTWVSGIRCGAPALVR